MAGNRHKKLPSGIDLTPHGYRLRLTWKSRQVFCGHYETVKLAEVAKAKYRGQIVAETFIPPSEVKRRERAEIAAEKAQRLTLAQWTEKWLESLSTGPEPRSPATVTSYASTMRVHVLPLLGDKPLTQITATDVEECIAKASEGGKEAAGRNVARYLRTCLNSAIEAGAGGLKSNPASGLKISTKTRRRTDEEIPTLPEFRQIVANLSDDVKLAPQLAAWCSLRAGEVLGLQRQDFRYLDDPQRAAVRIDRQWQSKSKPPAYGPCKDNSERTVSIPAALIPSIKSHLADYVGEAPESPVFPSHRGANRPISHNVLNHRWVAARQSIRPDVTFHSLRHFGLTMYAQLGATQAEIMARGGHRDAAASARYQHSLRDAQLTAMLNEVIEGDQE